MAVLPLRESIDSESPATISVTPEDGKVTRTFTFGKQNIGNGQSDPPVTNQQDIIDTLNALVGNVNTNNQLQNVALPRLCPYADAQFPLWYVRSVDSLRGVGQPTLADSPGLLQLIKNSLFNLTVAETANLVYQAASLQQFAMYPTYRVTVTFGPRPYTVLQDGSISPLDNGLGKALIWYRPSGTNQPFNIKTLYNEWIRYTDWSSSPQNDYVSQSNALYNLRGVQGRPNGIPFVGDRRMFMPNAIVKLNWWQVPLRFVISPNSYIRNLRGYVNQYAFYNCPSLVNNATIWPAGSLLYLNYSYTQYTSPLSNFMPWVGNFVTPAKLVNLELQFLQTDRIVTNAPTPTNQNYITTGHNALPWLGGPFSVGGNLQALPGGRQFYYATLGGDSDPPSFYSAPFELIFNDPDAQGVTPNPAFPAPFPT